MIKCRQSLRKFKDETVATIIVYDYQERDVVATPRKRAYEFMFFEN